MRTLDAKDRAVWKLGVVGPHPRLFRGTLPISRGDAYVLDLCSNHGEEVSDHGNPWHFGYVAPVEGVGI